MKRTPELKPYDSCKLQQHGPLGARRLDQAAAAPWWAAGLAAASGSATPRCSGLTARAYASGRLANLRHLGTYARCVKLLYPLRSMESRICLRTRGTLTTWERAPVTVKQS